MQTYSPPMAVTQTITTSYAVFQSSLVTILKELAKAKNNDSLSKMFNRQHWNKKLLLSLQHLSILDTPMWYQPRHLHLIKEKNDLCLNLPIITSTKALTSI